MLPLTNDNTGLREPLFNVKVVKFICLNTHSKSEADLKIRKYDLLIFCFNVFLRRRMRDLTSENFKMIPFRMKIVASTLIRYLQLSLKLKRKNFSEEYLLMNMYKNYFHKLSSQPGLVVMTPQQLIIN